MNLLGRKKFFLKSGLVCLLIPFFFACEDPTDLGIRVDSDNQNIVVRDTTISLSMSTILIDSLRTNQFSTILIGDSQDSINGRVTCTAYSQYGAVLGIFPGDSLQFISANIRFKINEVRTTDGTLTGELAVHESNDTLYNQAIYLADRTIDFDPSPIAEVNYTIDINQDSVLSIPVNDLGLRLFDQILRYDTDTLFRDSLQRNQVYFPPLVFTTTSSNSGLMNLSLSNDTTALWIEMQSTDTDSTFFFTFNFVGRGHFTNIKRDRSGSKLAGLNEEYLDEFDGPTSYGSMVDGTFGKVDISPLKRFSDSNPNLIVNNARINLFTTDYSSEFLTPFNTIRFYFIRNGRINGPIGSNKITALSSGILTENSYISESSDLLTAIFQTESPNYSEETTLFTQIFLDDNLGVEVEELVVLTPSTTSLLKTIYTKAEVTLFYTTIR